MTPTPIEVNVEGTNKAELQALLAKATLRHVVAGACGLSHADSTKVKVSFHPIGRNTALHDCATPCELMIEIIIHTEQGVMQPYADQLRDKLLRNIEPLRKYKVGISIPGQPSPYNTAVSQPEDAEI